MKYVCVLYETCKQLQRINIIFILETQILVDSENLVRIFVCCKHFLLIHALHMEEASRKFSRAFRDPSGPTNASLTFPGRSSASQNEQMKVS